jgi:hypothetical protein
VIIIFEDISENRRMLGNGMGAFNSQILKKLIKKRLQN